MTSLVTIFVPPRLHGTVFEEVATINGERKPMKYTSREYRGRQVADVPFGFFQRVIIGNDWEEWTKENPEAIRWMGESDRREMSCNAFPGEYRPTAPPPAAPVPVLPKKMRAPDGVTNFSHGGVHHDIAKDGTITVPADVADTLASFGFSAVA